MKAILFLLFLSVCCASGAQIDSTYIKDKEHFVVEFWDEITDTNFESLTFWEVDFYTKEFHFVLISAADSTEIANNGPSIPLRFYHRVKCDSVLQANLSEFTRHDSCDTIDYAGFQSYYDSLHFDTIVLAQPKSYITTDLNHHSIARYLFYKNRTKHGREIAYYSIDDLIGTLITGEYFRLKETGKWKNGKKVGKWKYYRKNGELGRIEKWRNGKLIRTKYPD